MTENKLPLRLDLQFFAEGDEDNDNTTDVDNTVDEDAKEEVSEDIVEGTEEEKLFTQSELNRVVSQRLEREREKAEKEQEQRELVEQNRYKELYEKEIEKREEVERREAERVRKSTIESGLRKHGINEDQLEKHVTRLERIIGDDEEEIDEVVKDYAQDFISAQEPKYKDPTIGSVRRKEPTQVSGGDVGKDLYKRIRG